MTVAAGFCPIITAAPDEFKHHCQQGVSLHRFCNIIFLRTVISQKEISSFFGHVCRTKNEVPVTESSYLLLQLWHLHLVPCKRCKHTCIPRNRLPVVLQFCNKDKTQLNYTYLITSVLVNTHICNSYLGLFQFICGDYFGVLL